MKKLYKLNLQFDIVKLIEDFSKHEDELIDKGSSWRFPFKVLQIVKKHMIVSGSLFQ